MRMNHLTTILALSFAGFALLTPLWGAQPCAAIPLTSLTLNGSAKLGSSKYLQLVSTTYQAGSAFIPTPYTLGPNDSFSAEFEFLVEGGNPVGDGLAFVAQNNGSGPNYLGLDGSGLGFFTLTTTPAIAATLDYQYNAYVATSPNTAAVSLPQGVVLAQALPSPPIFNSGGVSSVRNVWIDYDNPSKVFSIYYAHQPPKPAVPIVTTTLQQDLSSEFGGQVYLGLTAGTGSYDSQVYIFALNVTVVNQ